MSCVLSASSLDDAGGLLKSLLAIREEAATALEKMAHRLRTASRGKELYRLRKQTQEPVFGMIKSVMGYRRNARPGFTKWRRFGDPFPTLTSTQAWASFAW